jgi:trk system potassium uptake protein TrkH
LGATATLDALGKAAVIVVMFVGRLGPLTLVLLLGRAVAGRINYPDARLMVG